MQIWMRGFRFFTLFFLVIGLVSSVGSAPGKAAKKGAGFTSLVIQGKLISKPNQGSVRTEKSSLYVQNNRFRWEEGPMVRVFDGSRLLLWDTRSPRKVAIELTPPKELLNSKGKTASQLLAQLNASPQKGKKIGTGKVAGYLCDIYLNETPNGKQKVWLAKDLGVPLPLRVQFTGSMGSMELVAESVKTNIKIAEALFRLPAGYSVTRPPAGPPGGPPAAPPSKR